MLKHCVHYDSHMPTIEGVYNWVLDININFHVMHAQREDYDSFLIINQVISGLRSSTCIHHCMQMKKLLRPPKTLS